MLSLNNLHSYQLEATNFIINNAKSFCWIDLGLGKTVITLMALTKLIIANKVKKTLVIAPLRVANNVWLQEAQKWDGLNCLTFSLCTGSEKERIRALYDQANIYIINRENIKWLVDLLGDEWDFDTIVIDESSSFKSHSSQRFKALKKVSKLIDRIILLTGTPASNGYMDLWSQLFLIDRGERLGRTITTYRVKYFDVDYMGYNYVIKPDAADIIEEKIKDVVLSMPAHDYLQMQPRINIIENAELSKSILDKYKAFEKNLLFEFEDQKIEAINAAVLAGKLLQYANGAMYINEQKDFEELHTAKIDTLAEIIEENASENILVAYNFQSDLKRLTQKFKKAVVLDNDFQKINDWNEKKIKLMLAHPASAGHGLNLQYGGSIIVWFGLNWSLELYQQFNARLHRQGQLKPVRIIHIVAKNTIDERVMFVLTDKNAKQSHLINALRNNKI